MDLAFDHHHFDSAGFPAAGFASGFAGQRGYGVDSGAADGTCLPDWFGIKSRFQAAHALRRELALAAAMDVPGGSFACDSAPVLAASRRAPPDAAANCSQAVNLTASANGKPLGANDLPIVGNPDPACEEVYD